MKGYGPKMKALRHNLNKSIDDVSTDLDINPRSYRAYEQEERRPRVENMLKIADYFNTPVTELFFNHS